MRRLLCITLALIALPNAASANRGDAAALLKQGVGLLQGGDARSARLVLLNATKEDPDWAVAYAVHARALLELGEGVAAEAELGRAVSAGMDEARLQHLFYHAWVLTGQEARVLDGDVVADLAPVSKAYALRMRGRAATQIGDYDRAAREFDGAVALAPNSAFLWSDIGRFRMIIGNLAGAVAAGTRANALGPRNIEALGLMAELVRGQYGLTASLPWFEKILQIDRGNVPAMLEMAATLGDAGRSKDMLSMTRRVLSGDPNNGQAYYLQAVLAARAGKYDLARSLLYRTKGQLDEMAGAKLLGAILAMKEGNDELAIAQLDDIVRDKPDNITARRLLGTAMWRAGDSQSAISVLGQLAKRPDADSYTLSVVGRAYEDSGDRGLAAQYLERAARPAQAQPLPFDSADEMARLALLKGARPDDANVAVPRIASIIAAGNPAGALAEAQRLQRENAGAPAAHVVVGDAFMALSRPQEAVEAYKTAANIRFTEPVALRLIAALRADGNGAGALKVLDLFLQQNPRSVPAQILAADHFMATGQWDAAIGTLENVRARVGNRDATVLHSLAWAWANKGDVTKAREYSSAAYAIAPANAQFASSYGWFLFRSGRGGAQASVPLLRKAVGIAPGQPVYRYQLAQALVEAGQTAEARNQLKAALAVPQFQDRKNAAALLARLGSG